MARRMKGEEFTVVIPPEIQAKIDADPELAAMVRETNARLRQALDGVDMDDKAAVDAAMRSLGAEKIEFDDDDEGGCDGGEA